MTFSTRFKVPTFSYPGGKATIAPWLIDMMPRGGRVYCEPFAGRANVFWRAACKLRFEQWWLNDPYTAAFLHAITDVSLADIPFAVSWEQARDLVRAAADGTSAVAALLEPLIAFSGGVHGGSPGRSRAALRFRGDRYRRTIVNARCVLSHARPRITANDWKFCVANLKRGDFAYVDPPYMNADARDYRVNTVDHADLLRVLTHASFQWALSGYPSDLYSQELGDPVATRNVGCGTGHRKAGQPLPRRVECVWTNYDLETL